MINERYAKKFCKDDISKIENYYKAVADPTQTWHCHHKLELTLDGEFAHSRKELIRMNLYYQRPYFELVFLSHNEHSRLHNKCEALSAEHRQKRSEAQKGKTRSDETKRKISESLKGENHPFYGKHFSDETKRKMSDAKKGRQRAPLTAEQRQKISASRKGKHHSDETRKKMSEAAKRRWARQS